MWDVATQIGTINRSIQGGSYESLRYLAMLDVVPRATIEYLGSKIQLMLGPPIPQENYSSTRPQNHPKERWEVTEVLKYLRNINQLAAPNIHNYKLLLLIS